MDTLLLLMLVSLLAGFLPPAIGLWRGIDDWTMIRVWLWLLLPVIGWFLSLGLALSAPRRRRSALG